MTDKLDYPHCVKVSDLTYSESLDWLNDNFGAWGVGRWEFDRVPLILGQRYAVASFVNEEDAILFALTWGNRNE